MQQKSTWGWVAGASLVVMASGAATAQAAPTRADAQYYSVLGWGDVFEAKESITGSTSTITGNVGLAPNVDHADLADGTITGELVLWQHISDFAQWHSGNGTTVNGGTVEANSDVALAAANARAIGDFWAMQLSTSLGGSFGSGNHTIDAAAHHVYSLDGVDMSNGTITITGGINDFVVINVTNTTGNGGAGFKMSNSAMELTGGITADHVLWNLIGDTTHADDPDGTVVFTGGQGGTSFFGTFLGDQWAFKLNGNDNVYGSVWVGNDITIVSNSDVHGPSFNVTSVPLPASVWMGLGLMAAIGGVHVVRRRRSSLALA